MSTTLTATQQATPIDGGPKAIGAGFFQRSELGRALWEFRREFAWVLIFSCFANVLLLTPTLYMLQVFDRVMMSGSEYTLFVLTGIMVFFFLVMGFAEWVRARLLIRAGARFDERLNTRIFDATYGSRLNGASRNPLQPLGDLTQIRQFLTGNGIFALADTPWSVLFIAVLFMMHPSLGWASIGFSIVQLTLAFIGHRITSGSLRKVAERSTEASSFLQAKLRNAETVEALGMLGHLRRRWLGAHGQQMAAHADAQELVRRVQAVTKFVQYMQQSMMLALGALLAIDGTISPGAMIASNALANNALRPIGMLGQTWRLFVDARESYGRLEQVLIDNPARVATHQGEQVHGQISLRALVATAPGREEPILRGIDADFKAGEVVAILGPSGAGKSTLARCLLGIWPTTTGEVLLDGHSIDTWSREALGPHLGYLPQDIELFDGTIAENIARFGSADSSVVIEAATRAGIHDMILRLPKGYDTPMGEAGGLLSGGQRQRIGLARAILGEPALVVLDEPSANLDEAGEGALMQVVRELKGRGKTVFMIVHQQHLLAVADRVLILEAGRMSKLLPVVTQAAAAAQQVTQP